MRTINIFLACIFIGCGMCNAGIIECKEKQSEISKILAILNEINSINIDKANDNKSSADRKIEELTDPYVYARLVILAYYISYPGNINTIPYDNAFAKCSIRRMSKFKNHPNFILAMKFIENSIRLDAGVSEIFTEVLWEARNIPSVRKAFPERIKQWADGIKNHGTIEQKKALIEEEMQ